MWDVGRATHYYLPLNRVLKLRESILRSACSMLAVSARVRGASM